MLRKIGDKVVYVLGWFTQACLSNSHKRMEPDLFFDPGAFYHNVACYALPGAWS